MRNFKQSAKYEIVIGLIADAPISPFSVEYVQYLWQRYAEKFYDENGIYVSAIAVFGHAVYHTEWGCPTSGEQCLTFHCTANPEFIKDLEKYEEGVLYITKRLKRELNQQTITITKLPADICYLTTKDDIEYEYRRISNE